MNKLFITLVAAGCLLSSVQAAQIHFGDEVKQEQLVALSSILAAPEQYLEQEVTVQGTITAVCEKMHCWMRFATKDNEPAFRLKVRDGDMVFPLSAKGKTAYATGVLQPWPGSEEVRYQLVPSAVMIEP
ncbi:DUF4920 domain-containing protein [Alkalimonas collagenimarina]|uniref:DUF4920 domain-containing protein n=1 Tax=Alkalimonas collagenimarina TaxID=400390 RepID=A0ABT9GYS9_9GAMM|nr:DUF4920 domain-containing protein [Alkalimonas collagenimarina]MDP4536019.1 DUF4920 domain-containing protein [Alkalimonas collagenimarina]